MPINLGKPVKLSFVATTARGYHYQAGISGALWNRLNSKIGNVSSHVWRDTREALWPLSRASNLTKRSISGFVL